MKTAKDPRHIRREKAIKALFAWSFNQNKLANQLAWDVTQNLEFIDKTIVSSAPEWPIEQINRVDLAILRLAVYELLVEGKTPPKVAIDEAVELAKTFGSSASPAFVNGALGTVLRKKESAEKGKDEP